MFLVTLFVNEVTTLFEGLGGIGSEPIINEKPFDEFGSCCMNYVLRESNISVVYNYALQLTS